MKLHLCLSFLILAAGCTPVKQPPAPPLRALGQPASVEENPSDETIGLNGRRQLDLIGPAETGAIVVEVVEGVVTLRGAAPNQPAVWKAAAAARAVKGVKNVISTVAITAPAR